MSDSKPISQDTHRDTLLEEAVQVLNRYTHFSSTHRVTFARAGDRLTAHLERADGTPIPQSDTPLDRKLAHLKDQTVVIRPILPPHGQQPLGGGGHQRRPRPGL